MTLLSGSHSACSRRWLAGAATSLLLAVFHSAHAALPPASGLRLTWDTNVVRLQPGAGDNWPMAWVDDDLLITAWGDGEGFQPGPPRLSLGFARLRGNPNSLSAEDFATDLDTPEGSGSRAIKASGLLCVDRVLYLWVRNYRPPGSDDFRHSRLAWSKNLGTNWTWADWHFSETFGCPEFVQFGPNGAGARDGFVYVVSQANDSAYGYSPDIVLARVPKTNPPDRNRYEFFAGLDAGGKPSWSRDLAERKPIFTDPNGTQRVALTYNAGLRRYFLTTSHLPPGTKATHTAALGIFDAPEPWGPWTTLTYDDHWSGTNRTYHHKFPPRFISADGRTMWLVYSGLDGPDYTFCAQKAVLQEAPRATGRGTESATTRGPWFPFQPVKDDFAPTILDGSSFVEAPTGKHGFVTVKGDRFAFEDGAPVRFWGAQIGSWGQEQVDYAVRRMRRQGINVTRLHGLESLNARQGQTSFDYSAEGFARLDYLIAKLGENGIYLILDVHYPLTYRFKAGDNIPGLPEGGPAPYTQFFNERVAAIMHRRMTDVFTHLNPHTGKRYCDDPTLALVEVLNEDSLFWGGGVPAPFRTEFEERFAAWLRERYGDDAGLRKAWSVEGKLPLAEGEGLGPGQRIGLLRNTDFTEKFFKERSEQRIRGRDQLRFCLELEEKYWATSVAAMRKAGVRVPISGSNWQGHGFTTRVHMLGQAHLDYIDRHGYWDHPQGEGNAKWRIATALFHNLPMVKAVRPDQDSLTYLGVGNLVTEKAWEQVLGKPMTISEWNTCLPNEYSLEGTGLMAAYGLLQGWDGSLEFGYFSADWRDRLGGGSFDMLGNPPQILQFPAVSAMWLRGDVREAEVVAESLYTPETVFGWRDDHKPAPIAAALVGKVGYQFVEQDRAPIAKDIRAFWDPTNLVARSLTGELTWDAKQGFVRINTPRTQAVIGFLSAEAHALTDVRFVSTTRFGAVYVTAMDGQAPIASARRLLITAVGPARNTGMEYEMASEQSRLGVPYSRLKEVGAAPALLEAVTGELRVRSSRSPQLKAWGLDAVGRRVQEIPVSAQAGELTLALRPEHETVYYELAAE